MSQTDLLRLVTAGSVDDGKSTLIGRLLYECGGVYQDQVEAVRKLGVDGKIDYALLLDGLLDERQQGITIDVAYRFFSTDKRKFIIADTPGHEQYTRNMITGASNANVAVFLVDARKGMLTQSKRHLFLASVLGIPHVMVAINRMDLVNYSQEVFENLREEFLDYAARLDLGDLQFIPVSAFEGDMVTGRGENMPWYKGQTLLNYLENLQIVSDRNLIDARFPVQMVLRPDQDFRGYAGRVSGGLFRKGDKVRILPSDKRSKIKELLFDGEEVEMAFHPQSVVMTLEDERDVVRGNVIVREGNLPRVSRDFEAMVFAFGDSGLEIGKRYLIKQGCLEVKGEVVDFSYMLDVDSMSRVNCEVLGINDIARATLHVQEDLVFDVYLKNKEMGSFVIIDEMTNATVAAGVILSKGLKNRKSRKLKDSANSDRNNQAAADIFWFTGLSGSGKSTIAKAVRSQLLEEGIKVELLDGDLLREGLSKDLGFSPEDRNVNIERAGFVAGLLSKHGVVVLATFITPYEDQRSDLSKKLGEKFNLIHVNADLEVCEERDVKGFYERARKGEIDHFTGISDKYERPGSADLVIDSNGLSVEEATEEVLNFIRSKIRR